MLFRSQFMSFLGRTLAKEFAHETQSRMGALIAGDILANTAVNIAEKSALADLYVTKKVIGEEYPAIAKELRRTGRENLARIADNFMEKSAALYEHTLKKVREEMKAPKKLENSAPAPGTNTAP